MMLIRKEITNLQYCELQQVLKRPVQGLQILEKQNSLTIEKEQEQGEKNLIDI